MALYLTEDDVKGLLTMDIALEAVEEGFRQQALGRASNSPRSRLQLDGGVFNFMSAAAPGLDVMGTKTYGAVRGGSLRFHVQLLDASSGELLAMIEASALGQVRTGAASGVATKYMARQNATTVGVIGAGYQARTQLEAVCKVRGIARARVFSRTPERRVRFAQSTGPRLEIDIEPVDSAEACVRDADVAITITSASRPVLEGEWLSPGTHINAAGANHWMRRELDDEAVRRADVIVVDDVENARIECGDLLYPVERGITSWPSVHNLHEIISGAVPGRTGDDDITLFESQGLALEDIAVGRRVYEAAKEQGVGKEI